MSNHLKKRKPSTSKNFSMIARQNQKPNTAKTQTENLLRNIRQQAITEATSYSTEIMFGAFAIVLHEEYGFGTKRVSNVLKKVETMINAAAQGEITVTDVLKKVEEDLEIKISSE